MNTNPENSTIISQPQVQETPMPPPAPKTNWLIPILFLVFGILIGVGGLWGYQKYFTHSPIQPINYSTPLSPTEAPAQEETANWKTYTDKNNQFTFKYPSSYSILKESPNIELGFALPQDTAPSTYLRISKTYIDFSTYQSCYGNRYPCLDTINHGSQQNAIESINLGGVDAKSVYFLKGSVDDSFHTIQFSEPKKLQLEMNISGGQLDKTFQQILSTFRFIDQESTDPVVTTPTKNSKVASPLNITGTVPAGWMFEGSFPIKIVDSKRALVAQGTAKETVPGSWQTGKTVSFSVTLPFATTDNSGFLILYNDNPSGDPTKSKTFEVPVTF